MIVRLIRPEQVTFLAPIVPLRNENPLSDPVDPRGKVEAEKIFADGRLLLATVKVRDDTRRPLGKPKTLVVRDFEGIATVEALEKKVNPGVEREVVWYSTGRADLESLFH